MSIPFKCLSVGGRNINPPCSFYPLFNAPTMTIGKLISLFCFYRSVCNAEPLFSVLRMDELELHNLTLSCKVRLLCSCYICSIRHCNKRS